MSTSKDARSPITKELTSLAVRAVTHLRDISDAGRAATPSDVLIVQEAVVKALGEVYFCGLPNLEKK